MEQKNIFRIKIGHREELATQNLIKDSSIFGEKIISKNNVEYVEWDPYKSKLAASVRNGLQIFPIVKKTNILYITSKIESTILHISDIIGENGRIFLYSYNDEDLEKIISDRNNITILNDADEVQSKKVDVIYVDVNNDNEVEKAINHSKRSLKKTGFLMIILKKDEHINSSDNAVGWLAEQRSGLDKIRSKIKQLKMDFDMLQEINLGINYLGIGPFHKNYIFAICRYR